MTAFIDIVIVLWSGPFSYTSEGFPGFLGKVTYCHVPDIIAAGHRLVVEVPALRTQEKRRCTTLQEGQFKVVLSKCARRMPASAMRRSATFCAAAL